MICAGGTSTSTKRSFVFLFVARSVWAGLGWACRVAFCSCVNIARDLGVATRLGGGQLIVNGNGNDGVGWGSWFLVPVH